MNSNRIIPSDYRILLLLKMPILIYIYIYIYIYICIYIYIYVYVYVYVCVNNGLTILLSGLCFVMWTVILSFSSVYFTSCFNAILVSVSLVYEYDLITVCVCGNTAYRAIEPLKITAREIPSPRQPYLPKPV